MSTLLFIALTAADMVTYPGSLAAIGWGVWLFAWHIGRRVSHSVVLSVVLSLAEAVLIITWCAGASIAYSFCLNPAIHRAITACVLGPMP